MDCTNKFYIPKLCENTSFHNSNVAHGGIMNYQVTLTFMENQGNSLINTENMKVDEHRLMLIKTDCTIKLSIAKWCEQTPFHNSNVNHVGRNNYQVTSTIMENQGNSLINTENMKVDEYRLMLIKNRLHH